MSDDELEITIKRAMCERFGHDMEGHKKSSWVKYYGKCKHCGWVDYSKPLHFSKIPS